MSSIRSLFATDKVKEVEGIWVEYGESIKIKIARAGGANKQFAKTLEQLSRPHRRAIQLETLGQEASEDIMYRTFAQTVVLGWEGVLDDDGKPIAFSADACVKLFKEMPDFFLEVQAMATSLALWRAAAQDADAKN